MTERGDLPVREGIAPFRVWETWYRITGALDAGPAPLVVLHGGPGATHDYLLRLADLAASGRPVVHYDQLGSGRSTHLPEAAPELWQVELFLDELDNLLAHLGIAERYHLLGQSWGGMLAAEHAVRHPAGLVGLVLSNAPASIPLWTAEAARLRAALPTSVREALDRHEAAGTLDDPDYLAATDAYYQRHVVRCDPMPPEVEETFARMAEDPTVYHTMNGPNEFSCVGSLREWTIADRARLIEVPTLLCSGRYDEATPATIQPLADGIPDVRWEIFDRSSHMPFVEEPERYLAVVEGFLRPLD